MNRFQEDRLVGLLERFVRAHEVLAENTKTIAQRIEDLDTNHAGMMNHLAHSAARIAGR